MREREGRQWIENGGRNGGRRRENGTERNTKNASRFDTGERCTIERVRVCTRVHKVWNARGHARSTVWKGYRKRDGKEQESRAARRANASSWLSLHRLFASLLFSRFSTRVESARRVNTLLTSQTRSRIERAFARRNTPLAAFSLSPSALVGSSENEFLIHLAIYIPQILFLFFLPSFLSSSFPFPKASLVGFLGILAENRGAILRRGRTVNYDISRATIPRRRKGGGNFYRYFWLSLCRRCRDPSRQLLPGGGRGNRLATADTRFYYFPVWQRALQGNVYKAFRLLGSNCPP